MTDLYIALSNHVHIIIVCIGYNEYTTKPCKAFSESYQFPDAEDLSLKSYDGRWVDLFQGGPIKE